MHKFVRVSLLSWSALAVSLSAQTSMLPLPAAPLNLAYQSASSGGSGSGTDAPTLLTRQEAEKISLASNPQISVTRLLALAQKQVVRETRADYLPSLFGSVTGVGAEQASRLATGSLASSRLLNHMGAGVELNQLITDFGRTTNLIASSSLQAKAAAANAEATREDIVLATDLAFYRALEAQATLEVAKSTVAARQSVDDQVRALTASKLKSSLDLSFADVNLSEAKLLVLDAQNNVDAANAQLNEILGLPTLKVYQLVDDTAAPSALAPDSDALIQAALQQRPDLMALDLAHQASQKFTRAQREQLLPTVSAMGVVGATPIGSSTYYSPNWYGAAAVNISVPIFNGFRFTAEASEADFRSKAVSEQTRSLHDRIVRDVRTAWLTANTDQQRMLVTKQLVMEANSALDLAKARYQLGLGSIVELSQAQLQQTQAAISDANAKYLFESDMAAIRFQIGTQP